MTQQIAPGAGWLRLLSLALVTLLVVTACGPPDPILDARDCLEIYELHEATGPQGELLTFPDLSDEEIEAVEGKIEEFGEEALSDEADLPDETRPPEKAG